MYLNRTTQETETHAFQMVSGVAGEIRKGKKAWGLSLPSTED